MFTKMKNEAVRPSPDQRVNQASEIPQSQLAQIAAGGQDGSDLLIVNNGDGSDFCTSTRNRGGDVVPQDSFSLNFARIE